MNAEPVATAGIVTGASLALFVEPLNDLLAELGASPKLSSAITKLVLLGVPLIAAWWTRSRAVSATKHDAYVHAALSLPKDSSIDDVKEMVGK